MAQSNFTLILEGEEGEIETGDSAASNVLAKAANAATEENIPAVGKMIVTDMLQICHLS